MCLWRTLVFILDYEVIFPSWKDFLFPFVVYNVEWRKWLTLGTGPFMKIWKLTSSFFIFFFHMVWFLLWFPQDDKVRRCNDWTKWIPTTGRLAPESGPSPPDVQSSYMLSTSFQKMAVGDGSPSQSSMGGNPDANSMAIPENCSTESTGVLSQLPNGEVTQNNSWSRNRLICITKTFQQNPVQRSALMISKGPLMKGGGRLLLKACNHLFFIFCHVA